MTRLLRFDVLTLSRDRLAMAAVGVLVLACLVAVLSGHAWSGQLAAYRQAAAVEAQEARSVDRAAWAEASDLPAEEAALLPTRLRTTIALATPLLPEFSVGRSALEPTSATARLSTRTDALFARYEVENAERLARGGLDLAFVAVVLAPLILIAMGHGVFVADREAGTAKLWLAQAGSPLALIATRSVSRLTLVAAPLILSMAVLLALQPFSVDRAAAAALWLAMALLGLLFWWAVILLVNSLAIQAETSALILLGLWAGFVFVVPALTTSVATLIDPAPSRFEVIAVARQAEVAANRSYEDDHPELSAATLVGRRDSVLKGVEVRRSVADATTPIIERQERSAAAQRRTSELFGFISPPALTAEALARVARTDVASYLDQRRAATAHLEPLSAALTAAVLMDGGVDARAFDCLPVFVAPSPLPFDAKPVVWLAFLTLILLGWAILRLRRIRPI